MNREEFNQLDIKGQVEHFNNELKQENNNFNAICKQLGISKNTIMNRFNSNGFEPLRAGQRIISFSSDLIVPNSETENSVSRNNINKNLPVKNKIKISDPKDIDLILKRIELLERKVKSLESSGINHNKTFINTYNNTVTKTFKIDIEVYQELEKLFDKYKMYKRQDIVSSLLKYALDNIE
jgi:hypothetical protein